VLLSKQDSYLDFDLLTPLLDVLDLLLDPLAGCHQHQSPKPHNHMYISHFFGDEFQPPVDGHDGLGLVLLQQHRADLLVDVCVIVDEGELLRAIRIN
jgi:hypothetical protein